jgi:glyoxylase-like metal-dependent hydrolase (beta-lactamase superfamily II)
VHFAFWLAREPGVLFCPDLLMHGEGKELDFVPAEFHDDAETNRASVQRLLDLRFSVLCFNHGAPITKNPHVALRKVLRKGVKET